MVSSGGFRAVQPPTAVAAKAPTTAKQVSLLSPAGAYTSQQRRPWVSHVGGLGATLAAAQAMRRRRPNVARCDGRTTTAEKEQRIALGQMQTGVPSLVRFLSEDAALNADFTRMSPLTEEIVGFKVTQAKKTPLSLMNERLNTGRLFSATTNFKTVNDGEHLVLVTCNTDAGIVCGVGLDANPKVARHLAAHQVTSSTKWPEPLKELQKISEEYEGAKLGADVLQELGESHISSTSMTVVQPCGTSWKACLQVQFQGRTLFGASKGTCTSEEQAVASAGEAFYWQLRSNLRIPRDAPHAPSEWAEALRVDSVRQELQLEPICSSAAQAALVEALDSGDDVEKLREALEAASKRQEARIAETTELSATQPDLDAYSGIVARRCYEVTKPEDEDWRREEIKGKLPAEQVRGEISRVLEYNKTAVVSGGTGSGKSTQLPQFILDDWRSWEVKKADGDEGLKLEVGGRVEVEYEEVWYECEVLEVADDQSTITAKYFDGGDEEPDIDVKERVREAPPRWAKEPPRIVVTQPRRIAAVSLAERVAWERMGEVGGEIGHAIRGNTIMPESDTGTVEFCTVGTLLRRVVNDPLLTRYNVVILDEVHERDLMTDFLLILMREVLSKRPDLRLVLMSATLDVQTFVNYLPGCSVVEVPSGTRYPVEEIHLEDEWFAGIPEAQTLLEAEQEQEGDQGAGEHEWGSSPVDTVEAELQQEVKDLLEDKEMAELWERYADGALGGERDPLKHTAAALRTFLSRANAEDDDEEQEQEPPANVLLEQIKQLANYSDEVRQAWSETCREREEDTEWAASELLAFLAERGVAPWKVERASWELTSSRLWAGNEGAGGRALMSVAEQAILRVVPEMKQVPEEDDFGVGAVLCFLPGWGEIKGLSDRLEKSPHAEDLWVLKLHSSVSREEQMAIFEPAPEGKVKVILGTNIAESSVTINDVRVVVDAGLHRESTYDPKRRLSTLETVWICQSNAVQRKGRAGRVRSGRVVRLYSRSQFESSPWRPAPEMQRCNLAQSCLQAISLGRDPRNFLAIAPDPPSVALVESAMAELVSIDAIADGAPPRMLPLGQVLCRMPLEPLLGRAMILGTLFDVPQMTAALLAVSTMRTPFSVEPGADRAKAAEAQREFCPWSDTVAKLRAVMKFEHLCQERGEATAHRWAEFYNLNALRLTSFSKIRFGLLQDVEKSGLLADGALDGLDPEEWMGEEGGQYDEGGQYEESDGAIFQAEESAGLDRDDWSKQIATSELEVEDERLLLGILASAYPCNVAARKFPNQKKHTTSVGTGIIDKMSVNSTIGLTKEDEEKLVGGLDSPSWWLYNDLRIFNGQCTLLETTMLTGWHVALFAGLRAREDSGSRLELDGWINVNGNTPGTEALISRLREEVRQALIWASIATSYDRVACAAVARSKALLAALGKAMVGEEPSDELLEPLRGWKLPEMSEDENTLQADEEEDREQLEQRLFKKTVPELKVLLRELGCKVSGRKADLVDRCAGALLGEEEWGEGEGEGEEDWS